MEDSSERLRSEIDELELDVRARQRVIREKRARLAKLSGSSPTLVRRGIPSAERRAMTASVERRVTKLRAVVYAFSKDLAQEVNEPPKPKLTGHSPAEYRRLKYRYDKARLEWLLDEETRLAKEIDKRERPNTGPTEETLAEWFEFDP